MDRIDRIKGTFGATKKVKKIPPSGAAVARLPRYFRVLSHLIDAKVLRISSEELGEMMGLTASQVRQDLRHFGDFGQQGYGYQVKFLYQKIGELLGVAEGYRAVLVGDSPLQEVLLASGIYRETGIHCVLRLTAREEAPQPNAPLPTFPWSARESALAERPADLAVLCAPSGVAREVAHALVSLGVRAIFNCTGVPLTGLPASVVTFDFAPEEPLLRLLYHLTQDTQTKDLP